MMDLEPKKYGFKFDFFNKAKPVEKEDTNFQKNKKLQLIVYICILVTFFPAVIYGYYINVPIWVYLLNLTAFIWTIYQIKKLLKFY